MQRLHIQGGHRLYGTVVAGGSKNAVLPMMAAALLADGPVELENVPALADVDTLALVLAQLGVEVARQRDRLRLAVRDLTPVRADHELVARMRASFCVLGPLLARRRKAVVALPGGCQIGDRPVDLHLAGLRALGAQIELRHGYVIADAPQLVGAEIDLAGPLGPTVTGTANVLSAAVLAAGTTTIRHAACEPEIADLGRMLCAMGARIEGLGTSTLRITGVPALRPVRYRVIPDRIETATLLLAGAITGGEVTVAQAAAEHLAAVIDALRAAGACVDCGRDSITIAGGTRLRPVDITARPYPGIPTDVQAQWMAVLSLTPGVSHVSDGVFPRRFLHAAELRRLGAQIECRAGTARVTGVERLSGATVRATDLRASAALVLAGLAAQGWTTIQGAEHLDRGYDGLDAKLQSLGAVLRREVGQTSEGAEEQRSKGSE